ncbi:MAG: YraN family protein [Pseudomonadota bacterium]
MDCRAPGTIATGARAELAAAEFLEGQRLTILLRNYRCRMGELDLVARAQDGTVVIAEVRMRSSDSHGGAAASVNARKQRRIIRASRHLLTMQPQLARCAIRFDVLDLRPQGDAFAINWIRHAFVT